MTPPILILPGLFGSGPGHWQSYFEAAFSGSRRVEAADVARPGREELIERIDRAVADCAAPPVLVAHSLGCIAAVQWASTSRGRRVHAAFLVAPSDVDRPDAREEIRGFRPIPAGPLPFPSVVAGSSDDPYISAVRARKLARGWGSRYIDLGAAGHVNAASGFGQWPEGERLLRELLDTPTR